MSVPSKIQSFLIFTNYFPIRVSINVKIRKTAFKNGSFQVKEGPILVSLLNNIASSSFDKKRVVFETFLPTAA